MAAISDVAVPSESLATVSRSPAAPPKSAVLPLNTLVENAASSAVRSSIQEQSGYQKALKICQFHQKRASKFSTGNSYLIV
jgi:hypothetical protein